MPQIPSLILQLQRKAASLPNQIAFVLVEYVLCLVCRLILGIFLDSILREVEAEVRSLPPAAVIDFIEGDVPSEGAPKPKEGDITFASGEELPTILTAIPLDIPVDAPTDAPKSQSEKEDPDCGEKNQ
ncbi:UNVERIFIED_CONTAM: hypothetical protein Sradi_3594800 [Sesamum radiatum]|uniref:Uncharacterized protein n=1 Tax=Sesamum radiatum TaxID=300843 RepID=A0AAW2QGP5_SESRA